MEQRVRINTGEQLQQRALPIIHTLITGTGTGSAQTILTTRDSVLSKIERLSVANTSASPVNFTLHSVPPLGAIGTDNTELPAVAIPANTSANLTEVIGGLYEAGTELQVFASTGSVLVVHGWVTELL